VAGDRRIELAQTQVVLRTARLVPVTHEFAGVSPNAPAVAKAVFAEAPGARRLTARDPCVMRISPGGGVPLYSIECV